MKMNWFSSVLVVIALVAFHETGIAQKNTRRTPVPRPAPAKPVSVSVFGKLTDRNYENAFFGFKFSIPEDLTILNTAEVEVYNKAGIDSMKSNDKSGSNALGDAAGRSIPILAIAKLPPGSPGNSALEFTVAKQPAKATADVVKALSVKVMTATGSFKLTKNISSARFGGVVYTGVEMESTAFGAPLLHRTYYLVKNGYALVVGITFQKGTEPTEWEDLLNTFEAVK